jgi:hypothetical protein
MMKGSSGVYPFDADHGLVGSGSGLVDLPDPQRRSESLENGR